MNVHTVGSICSGIEAASVAWKEQDFQFKWFSEIAEFPSRLLKEKYPHTPNLGDMMFLSEKILKGEIAAPDLICGGTPCQAFSLAGWRNGLEDQRGNLTMTFVDIIDANDRIRHQSNLPSTIVFWENVEGVLKDKTNAFGSFISSLAGLDKVIKNSRWENAGLIKGPKRNVAWRVLDAKYFGIPQQRKRVYVLAGGTDFNPEDVLFEQHTAPLGVFEQTPLIFKKEQNNFEVFRSYTDVLYSAYGTKWNGNAAAYNGSLFIAQNNQIRRLSLLECERLMGFPDNYTNIEKAKRTSRYKALGNSWAVPVVKWIGRRIIQHDQVISHTLNEANLFKKKHHVTFKDDTTPLGTLMINTSCIPEQIIPSSLSDLVDPTPPKEIFISPVGCSGILRRTAERRLNMNSRLESIMKKTANKMTPEEIEKRSRQQKRGILSKR